MKSKSCFDAAVIGGGVVGATAARALAAAGLERIAHVAPDSAACMPAAGDPVDQRVYAISPGNAAFLAALGVWQRLPPSRVAPVRAMRVHGDDGRSVLEFDAYRAGFAELAWIVEDGVLAAALAQSLAAEARVTRPGGAPLAALEPRAEAMQLALEDGATLEASLVVGADGARSAVRAAAGIAHAERPYGQTAVVANFACARPHRGTALQWFQGDRAAGAVLALLPLPGDRVSLVWSVADEEAARLLALEPAALAAGVGAASHHALGELAPLGGSRGLALQRLSARRLAAPRVALAGDAAHVVHPLAGQGANLGLQDVRELAAVIGGREPGRDPGDYRLLRRYERARAEAILAMQATVHGLQRLFGTDAAPLARARNAGLNLVDRIPVLKNLLIRHAME